MFALVDCNNFYASCERVFRPDLNGKPVVVLSNNDGCIIARSDEAKKLGIPMGAPAFEYQELIGKNHVNVFSANFALYGDMSRRVMEILGEYTPDFEIYSIDEAFLKFEGFNNDKLCSIGPEIRNKVIKWTGIPISIGFAKTKALAKVANRIAKKFPSKTGNVHYIDSEEKRIKALKWIKIEDVWGIGRQNSIKLRNINVNNAYDFTMLNDSWVRKNLTVVGLRLKHDIQGIATLDLETNIFQKKEIAVTRSFEKDYTKIEELKERISTFAVFCGEKLRKQKSCCNCIMVFIHTNGFRKDQPQYSRNIIINLPFPTNSSIDLVKFSVFGLEKIFRKGYNYKKAGVIAMDFYPEKNKQLNIFENSDPRHVPLMKVIDKVNSVFGQQKIKLASQDLKKVWKMKQEKLSGQYTTDLNEIIIVHT